MSICRPRVVVAAAAAVAVLLAVPSVSRAEATHITTVTELPVTFTLMQRCTGQTVTFSGTFRFIVSSTLDPVGGRHLTIVRVATRITGLSSSGTLYRDVGAELLNQQSSAGGTIEETDAHAELWLAIGGESDLAFHATIHVTLTPSGEVTRFDIEQNECRG